MRQCLFHSSSSAFTRVIGLTNKSLEKANFLLPAKGTEGLELHSGTDLAADLNVVVSELEDINDIDQIIHVYYAGKHLIRFQQCSMKPRI